MDALEPAPPSDELLASAAQHFPQDNLALSRITARFQFSEASHEQEQTAQSTSIQELIYALKYHNKPSIGAELGRELGEFLASQLLTDYDALVPVPLHPARVRERGYNQAEILANGIARVLAIPAQPSWIRRSRYTRSQTLLSAKERTHNLQNVIVGGKERESIRNMRILLVDDILTTGATLNYCALALLECGARRVDAIVVAKA
jgi:ComF family protein